MRVAARDERPHRLFLHRVLARREQVPDGREPGVGVLAYEGLPKLPGIGAGEIVGVR